MWVLSDQLEECLWFACATFYLKCIGPGLDEGGLTYYYLNFRSHTYIHVVYSVFDDRFDYFLQRRKRPSSRKINFIDRLASLSPCPSMAPRCHVLKAKSL